MEETQHHKILTLYDLGCGLSSLVDIGGLLGTQHGRAGCVCLCLCSKVCLLISSMARLQDSTLMIQLKSVCFLFASRTGAKVILGRSGLSAETIIALCLIVSLKNSSREWQEGSMPISLLCLLVNEFEYTETQQTQESRITSIIESSVPGASGISQGYFSTEMLNPEHDASLQSLHCAQLKWLIHPV